MKKQIAIASLLSLGLGLALIGVAGAQSDLSTVGGSWMGDFGGSHKTWDVTLPANQDVTLTFAFWPCLNPGAFELEVWGAAGMMGHGTQAGACSKALSWNTGAGGPATIRLSNYFGAGVANWSLTASGMALPGGAAPAMMADEGAETMAKDETMAAEAAPAMAEEATMAADTAAAPAAMAAPAKPAAPASGMAGTLFGDTGGAYATHDMAVMGGKTYSLTMAGSMDGGGEWPGVGFNVWGPSGLVASSHSMYGGPHMATFTAAADGNYTVQVYNYHIGHTLFYAFEPVAAE